MIRRLPPARRDIVEIYVHYLNQGSAISARRFLNEAEATFQRLAKMPGLGAVYEIASRPDSGVRYFPISRFRNYIVFYRELSNGIEVLRLLHGARDLQSILSLELGAEDETAE